MRLVTVAIAFVLGGLAGMIATVLFLTDDYSYHRGELNVQVELGTKIPDVLGRDVDPREPMVPFFSAKTESVVVVTRHGVKTLRLCCDGSEPTPNQ
jgi:hypothetical protein